MGRLLVNTGSGAAAAFLKKNHIFYHPCMDSSMQMLKYGLTPCRDLMWMTTPRKTAASMSKACGSLTQKK
jgi:hypothetical protein